MWYRVLPGGVPGVLTGTYPGGFRYPFGIVPGVTCGKRLFRAKGRCGSGAGLVSAGVPPALSRLHCPPSPWAMAGRAVRAVRGRCGRLRATYTRSRDALPGSTGNGFVSGALLPLVASRAVCVGRIYFGLWRNYGQYAAYSGRGVPGMLRYVAGRPRRSSSVRCFSMVRTGSLQGRPAGRLALSRDGTA